MRHRKPALLQRKRFVILASYRSGSTLIARTLACHPHLVAHEEIFNVGNLARNLPELLEDPQSVVRGLFDSPHSPRVRAVGFKLMYQQATAAELDPEYWSPGPSSSIRSAIAAVEAYIGEERERYLDGLQRVWDSLEQDRELLVIDLVRKDLLASYVSFLRAMRDDAWIGVHYSTHNLRIDPMKCQRWFERQERSREILVQRFSSQSVLKVAYEDLEHRFADCFQKIFDFLGVEILPIKPAILKQRKLPAREVIENYEELCLAFEGTKWELLFSDSSSYPV